MSKPALIVAYFAVIAAIVLGGTWSFRGYQERKVARQLPAIPDLRRWPVELGQRVAAATHDAGNPSKSVFSLTDLALLYFANGYANESGQVLELLIPCDPKNARWPYLRGILKERAGQRDDAIHSFEAAAQLAPDYALVKSHLADLRLAAGQTKSERMPEQIHTQAADNTRPVTALSKISPVDGNDAAGIAIRPLVGGQASAPEDDPYVDEAYQYSYDTYRLQSFGEMRMLAERYQSAIFFLRRAVELEPADAAVQESLAAAYIGLHQLGDARQVLEAALRSTPANDALQARLAEVLIKQKEPGEALAMLERNLAKGDLPGARVHNARGEALAALSRWPEAAAAFETATKMNPIAPEFQLNLASCYLQLEKPEAAMVWAGRALALHPGDLRGLALSTTASFELNHFDEGLEMARQLAARAPENINYRAMYTSAILKAGNHWAELGQDARAERLYREGLAADENNGDLHGALGVLLSINRNFSNARSELETFLRLEPKNPLPYLLLGSSMNDSGQIEAAHRIWEQGLQVATVTQDEDRVAQLRALLAR